MTSTSLPGSPSPRLVPASWELPDAIAVRLGQRAGRQRLIAEDGHALLVLHQLPEPEENERRALLLWRANDGSWRAARDGKATGGDGFAALKQHLQSFLDRLLELDGKADAAKGASDYFVVLGAAQPLHRASRNLHRTLQALREHCATDASVLAARDQAYEVERMAELLVGDARNGLEYTIAAQGEAQSKVAMSIAEESRRLNQLAAICLPLSALSAVVGSSIPTGLESLPMPTMVFWLLISGALVLGVALRSSIRAQAR